MQHIPEFNGDTFLKNRMKPKETVPKTIIYFLPDLPRYDHYDHLKWVSKKQILV